MDREQAVMKPRVEPQGILDLKVKPDCSGHLTVRVAQYPLQNHSQERRRYTITAFVQVIERGEISVPHEG